MNKVLSILAVAACTLMACNQSVEPVEPVRSLPKTVKLDVRGGTGVYNECCNEWVRTAGDMMMIIGDDGVRHISFSNLTGRGFTSDPRLPGAIRTGTTYTQRGVATINMSNNGDGTQTATFMQQLINADGCSFIYKSTYHITTNANGEVVAEILNEKVICM